MWPSVVVFSRGRAVWSPWETETVEPAFGTYHFIQGEVGTNSTIKRLLFPLLFVWTLKLSFILDIHMIKAIIPSYMELMATFFKHETVVQSVTVGPRYGTGRFSLKSSVGQAPLCACLFSKTVHLTAHFLPSHQETIEVESENVFKLAAFALQVRKCVFGSVVWILSANVNEDEATFELLSFGAPASLLLSPSFQTELNINTVRYLDKVRKTLTL